MAGREGAAGSTAGRALDPHERIIVLKHLLTRENALAVVICLLLLALIIFLHGATPTFIYQGF
jgi:hypothetical protein